MNALRPAALLLIAALAGCQSVQPGADLLLINGNIVTEDPAMPVAQAMAVKDGRIVAVGSTASLMSWQGKVTRVVDLAGHQVLPGLIDSHIHSIEGALALSACSMDDTRPSLSELRTRVQRCAEEQPGDDWLQVINISSVGADLDRDKLDSILPDRPLFGISTDAHIAWANSKALEVAGITRHTISPSTGHIGHDAQGEPDGMLKDGATALVLRHIPVMPLPQRVEALSQTLGMLHETGITGFLEANSNAASVDTFCALHQQGRLTASVTLALGSEGEPSDEEFERLAALRSRAEQCGVKADTIKLYADGVMEFPTQTAGMLAPYLNDDGTPGPDSGPVYIPQSQFDAFAVKAAEQGFSLHVHAIGDGAIRETLNAFEAVRALPHGGDVRLSMAHLELIDQADLPRFAKLNVIASLQLLWAQPDEYSVDAVLPYLGKARHQHLYPAESLLQAGATIAGGSDWNVSSFNPFAAMATGVSRMNPEHPERAPLNIDEALTLDDMIRAYTINAAKLTGSDSDTGELAVGMQADFIVLAAPLDINSSPHAIRTTKVLLTAVKGETVFGSWAQIR